MTLAGVAGYGASDERNPFGDHLRYHFFRFHTPGRPGGQGLRQVHTSTGRCRRRRHFLAATQAAGLVRRAEARRRAALSPSTLTYFRERLPCLEESIFTVGGTVQAGGGRYVHRARSTRNCSQLCRAGTFGFVLTARQMGKSSLMVHTAERLAREEGTRSVIIDLSQIGVQVMDETWYLGLIITVARRLRLRTNVFAWWKEQAHLGFAQRMTQFFQDVLLDEVSDPVVIFIDEIDTTLSLPFTDDFFAAIRYVHNARSSVPAFQRLSFILIGVATPNDLINDPKRTPFNVGRRVNVGYFSEEEALPLADGFACAPEEARQHLRWVLSWTGGHPYLTQRLCAAAAEVGGRMTRETLDHTVAATFFGLKSEEDSNLRFVHDMLTRRAPDPLAVLTTYQSIRAGGACGTTNNHLSSPTSSCRALWAGSTGRCRSPTGFMRRCSTPDG